MPLIRPQWQQGWFLTILRHFREGREGIRFSCYCWNRLSDVIVIWEISVKWELRIETCYYIFSLISNYSVSIVILLSSYFLIEHEMCSILDFSDPDFLSWKCHETIKCSLVCNNLGLGFCGFVKERESFSLSLCRTKASIFSIESSLQDISPVLVFSNKNQYAFYYFLRHL